MKSYPMSIQWWYYDECNVTYEVLSSIQWWYYDECNVTYEVLSYVYTMMILWWM
jgi:hypothetical protein